MRGLLESRDREGEGGAEDRPHTRVICPAFKPGDPMAAFPQSGYDGADRRWKLSLSDPE